MGVMVQFQCSVDALVVYTWASASAFSIRSVSFSPEYVVRSQTAPVGAPDAMPRPGPSPIPMVAITSSFAPVVVMVGWLAIVV